MKVYIKNNKIKRTTFDKDKDTIIKKYLENENETYEEIPDIKMARVINMEEC